MGESRQPLSRGRSAFEAPGPLEQSLSHRPKVARGRSLFARIPEHGGPLSERLRAHEGTIPRGATACEWRAEAGSSSGLETWPRLVPWKLERETMINPARLGNVVHLEEGRHRPQYVISRPGTANAASPSSPRRRPARIHSMTDRPKRREVRCHGRRERVFSTPKNLIDRPSWHNPPSLMCLRFRRRQRPRRGILAGTGSHESTATRRERSVRERFLVAFLRRRDRLD
jgi:hypothetical protein